MPTRNEPLFDAPIPGMSLTHELGARPWQNPPQYTTVDEAIEYYLARMSTEEFNDQLIDIMEMGVPLTSLANMIQMSSVMDGKHSVDVGMLVMPVLIEMMMLIGDSAGIEYDSGLEDPNKVQTRPSLIAKLKKKLQDEKGKPSEEPEEVEPEEEIMQEETKGLMARRK